MTLLLRPFGFETLATHVYQYASAEQLEASALSTLAIVVVGLAPLIILSRVMDPTRKQWHQPCKISLTSRSGVLSIG